MEKRCVFWSRFWFCRFSAFFLALLILCTSAIGVDAATTTKNYSLIYTNSRLDIEDCNTAYGNENASGDSREFLGYHMGHSYQILVPSANVYAYKIKLTPSNIAITRNSVIWIRPVVGTYSDCFGGNGFIGKDLFNGTTSVNEFYIVTEGSTEPIFMNLLIKFHWSDDLSDVPSVNITSGNMAVAITDVSKSEYQNAMLQELENQTQEMEEQTQEMEEQTQELEEQTQELEEQTETQKGIFNSIKDFFGSFFQNLIDSVIGLFVPDKEELSSIFSRFDEFFSNKFGFLYFPFEVLGKFLNLFGSAPSAPQLTLPGFSIMGHQVWDRQTYNLLDNSLMLEISNYVRMGTSAILIFAFINYCGNKFKGVVNK